MIECPQNNIIVKVKTKWVRNMTELLRRAAVQNNTSIEQADFVNNLGEIVALPRTISKDREYIGFSTKDIQVGDTAIFSYLVIYDFLQKEPHADPIYRNRLMYKGEEYFMCDIQHLFAVIRDTKIRMQNGYVMVEDMDKPSKIVLPTKVQKMLNVAAAVVSHIGKPLEHLQRIKAEVGDRVYFNPVKIQLYQINMKPFGILRQSDILGRKVLSYEEIAALN